MIQHTTRKHARLSASRTERFMACPGSVLLENRMPYEPPGEAAAIGTAIHELSEAMLRGDDIDTRQHPKDHLAMAEDYVKFVNTLCESPRKKLIEVNVDAGLKSLHPALGGTADAVLVEGNTMHVIDLKTGRVPVDAEENPQLMTYALGAMRQFNAPAYVTIVLHIFQPRVGHSQWQTDGHRLLKHAEELKAAATMALADNAPTTPGEAQCKYCRAKTICPSLRSIAAEAARKDFLPDTKITPDMIEEAKLAAAYSEAVLESAKHILANGETIQGWELRNGRKTKFWREPELVMEFMKSHPNAWELKSPSAISKEGIEVPENFIGEKQSAPSLVKTK